MASTFRTVLLALCAGSALTAATAPPSEPESLAIEEIKTLRQERPRFPATMRAIGVKEGSVSLVVSVDEFGAVTDVFVAESSRQAFADSALKSIQNWEFEPARYNGTPFPSTLRLDLDFRLGRSLQWQTFTAPVETNVARKHAAENPVTAIALRKLDNIPMPVEIVEPETLEDGQATIEFYIDELGNVRCPKLLGGNDLEFARRAIDAISRWRFEPPMAGGVRTNTVVRQTFHYQDGRLATSKPR